MRRLPVRRVWVVVPVLCLAPVLAVLSACGGPERSPEAYCRAFYETAAPLRAEYEEAGENVEEDPLGAIVTLFGSPGDLKVMLDRMVDHAPEEIQSDTEAARDALAEQQESLGDVLSDPLGAIGGGLAAALTSSGSFARVDSYLADHCPVDSELAREEIAAAGEGAS